MKTSNEFTPDNPDKIGSGAVKYDGGKSPVFCGALDYFPRALAAVADVSAFGASKYAWKGWQDVDNGFERYSDALVRHLTAPATGDFFDKDSGLLHEAHAAWNALARLELRLAELAEEAEEVEQEQRDAVFDVGVDKDYHFYGVRKDA